MPALRTRAKLARSWMSSMKTGLTALLSTASALAAAAVGAALAQTAPAPAAPAAPPPWPPPTTPGDLPLPASPDNAGVSKWLHDHIKVEGWAVLAADRQAVALGSPEGVVQRPDGFPQANVRHEYYVAIKISGQTTRSNLQTRVFDCPGKRQRVISMDIYEKNNLSGQSYTASNANAAWTTPQAASLYGRVLARVCAATRAAPVQ